MARFTIYNPNEQALCEGSPVYNGAYMKPSSLTFRKISSPTPINWEYGSFVEYRRVRESSGEWRAPEKFYLYDIPQVKRRARTHSNGFSFEYENVVFYDQSKLLEYCPFRDLVTADNQVHFSSRPSFSTYEAVDGIARRIEACLTIQYPSISISVAVATAEMGASQELLDLMAEPREFAVDLVSCLGALDHIYQVWPNVGWVFQSGDEGDFRILIGGAGLIGTQQNWCYGRGWGLKEISRTLGNINEIVNRIYPFGNTTNMPLRYYNGYSSISHNDSVDIPNLMPPIADWGKDEELKSVPAKAFYEDAASIARIGLRPRRVYFDGSDDIDNIYPTIKGMTIGDVDERALDYGDVDYPPDMSIWHDNDPLDEVLAVQPNIGDITVSIFDDGLAGDNGKGAFFKSTDSSGGTASRVISNPVAGSTGTTSLNVSKTFTLGSAISDAEIYPVIKNAVLNVTQSGGLTFTSAYAFIIIQWKENGQSRMTTRASTADNNLVVSNDALSMSLTKSVLSLFNDGVIEASVIDAGTITMSLAVTINYSVVTGGSPITVYFDVAGDYVFTINAPLLTNFRLFMPPFGYDLTNILSTDGSVRIAMTSGKCAGREFVVTACSFDEFGGMILSLNRQYDDSLSQYFPNSSYPIEVNDTFVILGIAMPDMYITAAASRLKTAAQKYLNENKKEIWQYNPTIDDKYMVDSGRIILPGQNMVLIDPELIEGDTLVSADPNGYVYFDASDGKFYLANSDGGRILLPGAGFAETVLVDSVSVDEGAVIPAWKVTLRDRKKQKRN